MKIFEISLKDCDFDEYDAWIVIAENEEEVKKICDIRKERRTEHGFYENQYEDNIEYIKVIGIALPEMEKGIVLGSFNLG